MKELTHPSVRELIGKPHVARVLGVTPSTAHRRMLEGAFPSIELDGRLFARRSDVEAYRDERARAQAVTLEKQA